MDYAAELARLAVRLERVTTLDSTALEQERIAVLGRKQGALKQLLQSIASLTPEQKRVVGAEANRLKQAFEAAFAERQSELAGADRAAAGRAVDRTMPARHRWTGAEHPVTRVVSEIVEIFRQLGFAVAAGPEIETEWYNFGALNFPADHPAMDIHDTLYVDLPPADGAEGGSYLLRTHTSPVQIRTLLSQQP
ncbi:MAG TPA: hypothetical protein VFL95_08690, partial [Gemmatimonadales bacterium]|nr:hypothetical protein [Gemmatimonadales bacterium]